MEKKSIKKNKNNINTVVGNNNCIKFITINDNVQFQFYGTGRHYGFELEVERLGEIDKTNEELINIIGKNREWLYFMEDHSLFNGFEIISHPCTIDFIKEHLPKLLKELQDLKLGEFETTGLHFHVDRKVFGDNSKKQLSTIGNAIKIISNNFDIFKKVCGRTVDTEYTHNWKGLKNKVELLNNENPLFLGSDKHTDNSEYTRFILKKDYSTDKGMTEIRNKPLNLLKKKTVEFRLPQATTDYNNFMGRLLLFDTLINNSINDNYGDFSYLFKNKDSDLDKYLSQYDI